MVLCFKYFCRSSSTSPSSLFLCFKTAIPLAGISVMFTSPNNVLSDIVFRLPVAPTISNRHTKFHILQAPTRRVGRAWGVESTWAERQSPRNAERRLPRASLHGRGPSFLHLERRRLRFGRDRSKCCRPAPLSFPVAMRTASCEDPNCPRQPHW